MYRTFLPIALRQIARYHFLQTGNGARPVSLLTAIFLLSAATAEAPQAPAAPPTPAALQGPLKLKASQIKAYNAGLAKDDPHYIRCDSEKVTGSIAMRKKTCRTNKEWARLERDGNDAARSLADAMNKGWTSGEPPAGDVRPGT
jgi:hypothetical protein